MYPITTGLLDYFPDACALVAEVSFLGNQKHNPGEPLHWARGKSMDHADCIARHLIERGGFDGKLRQDRKSTRLNSSHQIISYAVFCLKKKKKTHPTHKA